MTAHAAGARQGRARLGPRSLTRELRARPGHPAYSCSHIHSFLVLKNPTAPVPFQSKALAVLKVLSQPMQIGDPQNTQIHGREIA